MDERGVGELSMNMKKSITHLMIATAVMLVSSVGASAADLKDEIAQSEKGGRVFKEIMATPDKGIPRALLDDAECVAVFPNVVQAAFAVGGRGGRGVASCRTPTGWSAPAYFKLGGGSFGFQIGVESTDLIMLFMTPASMKSLLSSKFELGANASVAAGPVGRQTGAATDAKFTSEILSYSRNKGLFAGVALKGAVIEMADDDMRDVYGPSLKAADVLNGKGTAPATVMAFPSALTEYSKRKTS
jgi:SH3 domain-containing YSC84-like protein 1